jgi:hypothetical protein
VLFAIMNFPDRLDDEGLKEKDCGDIVIFDVIP